MSEFRREGNDLPTNEEEKKKLPQTAPMPEDVARDRAKLREMLPVPEPDEAGESPPKVPPEPPQDLAEPREHGTTKPRQGE